MKLKSVLPGLLHLSMRWHKILVTKSVTADPCMLKGRSRKMNLFCILPKWRTRRCGDLSFLNLMGNTGRNSVSPELCLPWSCMFRITQSWWLLVLARRQMITDELLHPSARRIILCFPHAPNSSSVHAHCYLVSSYCCSNGFEL